MRWGILMKDVAKLARAAKTRLYTSPDSGFRRVVEHDGDPASATAISLNPGPRFEGGGPYAGLRVWGQRWSAAYCIEIGPVGRFEGAAAFRRNLQTCTAKDLYTALVELCAAQCRHIEERASAAAKTAATEKRLAKQRPWDDLLLVAKSRKKDDLMGARLAGPGHRCEIETATSGYTVASTFSVTVDETAPPAIRTAFDILVRQWRGTAKAYPYPKGEGD